MVRKKRKSKRLTLKTKYMVEKKVKNHNRKMRRLAAKGLLPKKHNKDPGIPNLYPFKEALISREKARLDRQEKEKAAQKKKRQRVREKRRRAMEEQAASFTSATSMSALAQEAAQREREFEFREADRLEKEERGNAGVTITWKGNIVKDHSRNQFRRDFQKVVLAADVLLFVLDARDPLGCRSIEVEERIQQIDPNKKVVLVLNKIDLVPRNVVQMWLAYLRSERPTVLFKASTQTQQQRLAQSSVAPSVASDELLASDVCIGADILLKLLKNYCRNKDVKTKITVGVIGMPNTGKSSLINSLKRAKAARVGARAGQTRHTQEVKIDSDITLIDSPGVVFTTDSVDSSLILRNTVDVTSLVDPVEPIDLVLQRCHPEQLMQFYGIGNFKGTNDFLAKIARSIGRLKKGSVPDYNMAALHVLRDWTDGSIPYYTLPPERRNVHVAARIVSSYSEGFELEEVADDEAEAMDMLPTGTDKTWMMMAPGDSGTYAWDDEDEADMDGVTATGMVGGDDEAGMDDGDANSDGGDAQGISVAPEDMDHTARTRKRVKKHGQRNAGGGDGAVGYDGKKGRRRRRTGQGGPAGGGGGDSDGDDGASGDGAGNNEGGMGDVYDFATDFRPVANAFDSEEDESSSGIF